MQPRNCSQEGFVVSHCLLPTCLRIRSLQQSGSYSGSPTKWFSTCYVPLMVGCGVSWKSSHLCEPFTVV